MFERFSKGTRSAVVTAVEEAEQLQSERVGAEHLLLGLLRQAEPDLAGHCPRRASPESSWSADSQPPPKTAPWERTTPKPSGPSASTSTP